MALSSINRTPPGFEKLPMAEPKVKMSGFANNKNFGELYPRGKSPPMEKLNPPITKKKPIAKRSHQNIVAPLVAGIDSKSDFNLYKDLTKEKYASDSLSDDNEQDFIKEEEDDDSEEEKISTTSSSKPKRKQSGDNPRKLIFYLVLLRINISMKFC